MDWKTLYFDAKGRIGQRDFWLGLLILFGVSIVLNFIPVVGQIAQLALTYAGVCVMSKRLHDLGKSGWLAAVPYGLLIISLVLTIFTVLGMVGASASGSAGMGMGALAGVGIAGTLVMIAGLVWLGFVLWVGLSKGQLGDNQYGPPPHSLIGGGTVASASTYTAPPSTLTTPTSSTSSSIPPSSTPTV